MNHVFKDHLRKFILVFFDEILVYSKDWEQHLSHLKIVLEIMKENSLHAYKKKCTFGSTQINYLGHVISATRVTTEPEKI